MTNAVQETEPQRDGIVTIHGVSHHGFPMEVAASDPPSGH
jgi:hypothetical protein